MGLFFLRRKLYIKNVSLYKEHRVKKKNIKKSLLYLLALIFIWSCSDNSKINYVIPKPYSIRISNELNIYQADSLKNQLKSIIPDSLFLINDDDFYTINIGYFNSSLSAGEKAFNYFCDSLIGEYSIYYGDSVKVYDEYRYVPFLGKDFNRPALFKYDLLKKKKRIIWSKWGRKILNLSYPKNFSPAYFYTALTYGRDAGFPYITDVRVYKFNIYDNTIKRLEKIGKGLQVFSEFDSSWYYNVYFNILDSTNTSDLIQIKNTYNAKGVKIESSEKIYNILDDGYPMPRLPLPKLVSPNRKYFLKAEGSDTSISYFLNNYDKNKRDFVFSSELEPGKIEWSRNEDYLMISFKNPANNEDSKLLLIETDGAAIIKEFNNSGALNFIVHGDLLIFDSWNLNDSQIIIYNYKKRMPFDTLSVYGGCGLNYIKSEYIGY